MQSTRGPRRQSGARRPIDLVTAAYLLVTAVALAFPHRPAAWPALLAAHLAGAWLLLGIGPAGELRERVARAAPRLARRAADWYPLLIMPLLYKELAILNVAVHDGRYFDPLVLEWEEALFGGQPSRDLARALPFGPLSELLHAAYIAYYLIIFVPPMYLYATQRRHAFRYAVFTVMLTFYTHYLFFAFFPVQGPRYLFEPPVAEAAQGPVYTITHEILEAGSSRGAAFPSSHVGVAVAQTVAMARVAPPLAPVLAVVTIGLALGAVYGGFHYAVDALAGLLLGLLVALLAPALRRALG